jgi:hypothetical protein
MNVQRQEIDAIGNKNISNSYKLNWNDGTFDVVTGPTAEDAFKDAGYGEVDLSSLRNYEKLS